MELLRHYQLRHDQPRAKGDEIKERARYQRKGDALRRLPVREDDLGRADKVEDLAVLLGLGLCDDVLYPELL